MLLALFLINLAAGLYLFLPLVGRRNAGVKFYRLIFIVCGALNAIAAGAHWMAGAHDLAIGGAIVLALIVVVWVVLRYPKRLVFRVSAAILGLVYVGLAIGAFDAAVRPHHMVWSIAGSLASVALLGSVNLAMLLGHWYLVVRGMPIEPLKRLTIATLVATIARIAVVFAAMVAGGVFHEVAVRQGIFFWMRAGWGLAGPLVLFPMVWGTVKLRSTMAATGILYVDVVAVVIGEVLGAWLAALVHMPM
jgi:hypothetical protein